MADINVEISRLVRFGLTHGLLQEEDAVYAANRILAVLQLEELTPAETQNENLESAAPILNNILDWAAQQGLIEPDTTANRDVLDTELMTCLMPRPSEVTAKFKELFAKSTKEATDYFYKLSRDSNYIRTDRVKKDEAWAAPTDYGELIITINLSKPEKDPKEIAAARNKPASGYPQCLLCRQNEGYKGSLTKPARGSHRLIPLELCGGHWFLQYSPYVYYNEHCILLNEQHIPMKVSKETFQRLLSFVEMFPHYFIGSNADLPIVGGSILSHDHFQGGNFEFPMAKAPVYRKIAFSGYEDIEAGLVKWPMSVIRLRSSDKERLCSLANCILQSWRGYSDESAGILAFTDGTPHNTITPICRMRNGQFEIDLVLRNNRTTEEHPLGIFHPHAEYHHIKKENIGLIEVMGLAILPARLKTELKQLAFYLQHPEKEDELAKDAQLSAHLDWYKSLKARGITTEEELRRDIGVIFAEILGNAGVYKDTEHGKSAFLRFVDSVNCPQRNK